MMLKSTLTISLSLWKLVGPRSWGVGVVGSSKASAIAQAQSLPQLRPTLAPATLTVEGEVSKGRCESIHDEHSPDGHVGHSLHPALGGAKVHRSWDCHVYRPDLVPEPSKLAPNPPESPFS